MGWFDTERKEPCDFGGTTDGVHCVPMSLSRARQPNDPDALFADTACTQPLAIFEEGECERPYVEVW